LSSDKRHINRGQRFKWPEYWPFRALSGEQVTNQLGSSAVYEPFNLAFPTFTELVHEAFN